MAHRTSILVLGALTLAACNATPSAGAEAAERPEGATPVPVPSYLEHAETEPAAAQAQPEAPRTERRVPSADEAFGTGTGGAVPHAEPARPEALPAAPPAPLREERKFGPASGPSDNATAAPPSVSNDTGAPTSSPPAPRTSLHAPTTAPAPRTSGSTGGNGANTDPNGRAPRTSGSSGAR